MSHPFTWQPEYELNYPLMDNDHRESVILIEAIRQASEARAPDLKDRLIAFSDHCAAHFAREEEIMMQTGFPAFEIHKQEHDRVLKELDNMVRKLDTLGEEERRLALEEGLKDWLLNHLATMDTATARFVKAAA